MLIGVFLLLIGALLLLDKVGVIHFDFGDYILPIALVALGVSFIADRWKKRT
ncbi:MAG: hypothetical protein JSV52_07025 [Candidatus Zixiibacteriota bacterium]|nr:MAG: hypothetical protein JSV52_07025 [candidate division Zixibacteria bacterium]